MAGMNSGGKWVKRMDELVAFGWMLLITAVLLVLKLTGTYDLPWWGVFEPVWLPAAGIAVILGVGLAIAVPSGLIKARIKIRAAKREQEAASNGE